MSTVGIYPHMGVWVVKLYVGRSLNPIRYYATEQEARASVDIGMGIPTQPHWFSDAWAADLALTRGFTIKDISRKFKVTTEEARSMLRRHTGTTITEARKEYVCTTKPKRAISARLHRAKSMQHGCGGFFWPGGF